MPDQQDSDMVQQITGQVRSMFYLVDELAMTLTIQTKAQTITVRASGQVALDLRTLPAARRSARRYTLCDWNARSSWPSPLSHSLL